MEQLDELNPQTDMEAQLLERFDAGIQKILSDHKLLSKGAVVRILHNRIEQYLARGLTIDDIVEALKLADIKISKTHLVRNLGELRKERENQTQQSNKHEAEVAKNLASRLDQTVLAVAPTKLEGGGQKASAAAPAKPSSPPQRLPMPPGNGVRKLTEYIAAGVPMSEIPIKAKIDYIIEEIPSLEREFPELLPIRTKFADDEDFKQLGGLDDILDEKLDKIIEGTQIYTALAHMRHTYRHKRNLLLERLGLGNAEGYRIVPRYNLAYEALKTKEMPDLDGILRDRFEL